MQCNTLGEKSQDDKGSNLRKAEIVTDISWEHEAATLRNSNGWKGRVQKLRVAQYQRRARLIDPKQPYQGGNAGILPTRPQLPSPSHKKSQKSRGRQENKDELSPTSQTERIEEPHCTQTSKQGEAPDSQITKEFKSSSLNPIDATAHKNTSIHLVKGGFQIAKAGGKPMVLNHENKSNQNELLAAIMGSHQGIRDRNPKETPLAISIATITEPHCHRVGLSPCDEQSKHPSLQTNNLVKLHSANEDIKLVLLDGSCYARNKDLEGLVKTAKKCKIELQDCQAWRQLDDHALCSGAKNSAQNGNHEDNSGDFDAEEDDSDDEKPKDSTLQQLYTALRVLRTMRDALDETSAKVVSELLRCIDHVVFWDTTRSFAAVVHAQERERAGVIREHGVWTARIAETEEKVKAMRELLTKATSERKAWQGNLFKANESKRDIENEEANLNEELRQRRIKTRAMIVELDNLESRLAASENDLQVELAEEEKLNSEINEIQRQHIALKEYYRELHGAEIALNMRVPERTYNRALGELEALQEHQNRFDNLEASFANGMGLKTIRLDQVRENLEVAKRVRIDFENRVPVTERPENRGMTPRPEWAKILKEYLPCLNKTLRNHPAYSAKVSGISLSESLAVQKAANVFRVQGRRRRPERLKRTNSIDSEPFTFAASRKMLELLLSIKDHHRHQESQQMQHGNNYEHVSVIDMIQTQINNVRDNIELTLDGLREAEKCIPRTSEYFGNHTNEAPSEGARPARSARRASISLDSPNAMLSSMKNMSPISMSFNVKRRTSRLGTQDGSSTASPPSPGFPLSSGNPFVSVLASMREDASSMSLVQRNSISEATNSNGNGRKLSATDQTYNNFAERARKVIAKRRGGANNSTPAHSGRTAVVNSVIKLMQDEKQKRSNSLRGGELSPDGFGNTKNPERKKSAICLMDVSELLTKPLSVTSAAGAPTFVVCLGIDSKLPRFLRAKGKVQFRQIKPEDLSAMVDSFIDARSTDLQLNDKALDELIYLLLRKKFGIQSIVTEWGYNFVRELFDQQENWAIAKIMMLILSGEAGECFLALETEMLMQLHSFFKRIDIETQKKTAGSSQAVGCVRVADVIESLHKFIPRARASEQSHWGKLLTKDARGLEYCTYARDLFMDPRNSAFLQAIILHVVDQLCQNMKGYVTAIQNLETKISNEDDPPMAADDEFMNNDLPDKFGDNSRDKFSRQPSRSLTSKSFIRSKTSTSIKTVTLSMVKGALGQVDAGVPMDEVIKAIGRVLQCKPERIKWDKEVNPSIFAQQFRKEVILYPSRPILNTDSEVQLADESGPEQGSLAFVAKRAQSMLRRSASKRASFRDIQVLMGTGNTDRASSSNRLKTASKAVTMSLLLSRKTSGTSAVVPTKTPKKFKSTRSTNKFRSSRKLTTTGKSFVRKTGAKKPRVLRSENSFSTPAASSLSRGNLETLTESIALSTNDRRSSRRLLDNLPSLTETMALGDDDSCSDDDSF